MNEETIIIIVVSILIFLLIREVICWYWKINQNVALLTEIRDLLKAQAPVEIEAETEQTNLTPQNQDPLWRM